MNSLIIVTEIQQTESELRNENTLVKRIWINNVKGWGVFAKKDIAENTKLLLYPGIVYKSKDSSVKDSTYAWAFYMVYGTPGHQKLDDNFTIDAGDIHGQVMYENSFAPFVNEPDKGTRPNVAPVMNLTRRIGSEASPALEYWTTKPIKAGEEILICYLRKETMQNKNGKIIVRQTGCTRGSKTGLRFVYGTEANPRSRPSLMEKFLTEGPKRKETNSAKNQPNPDIMQMKALTPRQLAALKKKLVTPNTSKKRRAENMPESSHQRQRPARQSPSLSDDAVAALIDIGNKTRHSVPISFDHRLVKQHANAINWKERAQNMLEKQYTLNRNMLNTAIEKSRQKRENELKSKLQQNRERHETDVESQYAQHEKIYRNDLEKQILEFRKRLETELKTKLLQNRLRLKQEVEARLAKNKKLRENQARTKLEENRQRHHNEFAQKNKSRQNSLTNLQRKFDDHIRNLHAGRTPSSLTQDTVPPVVLQALAEADQTDQMSMFRALKLLRDNLFWNDDRKIIQQVLDLPPEQWKFYINTIKSYGQNVTSMMESLRLMLQSKQ